MTEEEILRLQGHCRGFCKEDEALMQCDFDSKIAEQEHRLETLELSEENKNLLKENIYKLKEERKCRDTLLKLNQPYQIFTIENYKAESNIKNISGFKDSIKQYYYCPQFSELAWESLTKSDINFHDIDNKYDEVSVLAKLYNIFLEVEKEKSIANGGLMKIGQYYKNIDLDIVKTKIAQLKIDIKCCEQKLQNTNISEQNHFNLKQDLYRDELILSFLKRICSKFKDKKNEGEYSFVDHLKDCAAIGMFAIILAILGLAIYGLFQIDNIIVQIILSFLGGGILWVCTDDLGKYGTDSIPFMDRECSQALGKVLSGIGIIMVIIPIVIVIYGIWYVAGGFLLVDDQLFGGESGWGAVVTFIIATGITIYIVGSVILSIFRR